MPAVATSISSGATRLASGADAVEATLGGRRTSMSPPTGMAAGSRGVRMNSIVYQTFVDVIWFHPILMSDKLCGHA